jgi:hypothetical protein
MPHDPVEFFLHALRHVRPRLQKVLEIGGGEDQHLASAVVPVHSVALEGRHHTRPCPEILEFLAFVLSEQVVGDANGHQTIPVQSLDDRIIIRVILKTTASVDNAGDPEAVEFPHEVSGRVDLIVDR